MLADADRIKTNRETRVARPSDGWSVLILWPAGRPASLSHRGTASAAALVVDRAPGASICRAPLHTNNVLSRESTVEHSYSFKLFRESNGL